MEIANQMHIIVEGLKKVGEDAKAINYYPNYLGYKSDMVMNIKSFSSILEANEATKLLASRIIADVDVFHYHFGTSLTLDGSDLPLLKELNKKVVMHHWGSDVRIYSQAVKLSPFVNVKCLKEDAIKRRLEQLAKYIDTCIVSDYELYEYVKDYYSNLVIIPQAIDLNEFNQIEEPSKNKKITIVHAPTSPEIKGTIHILQAIEMLQSKYDFDFKLIQGISYEEAKKTYVNADIIIDQILIGSYGLCSIENMSFGKPVVCYISDFMQEKYPRELPIISANPTNIKEKIEFLLNNRDCLSDIGMKSRKYAKKHHDINKLSRRFIELYQVD
ncbi:MAG: transferase [Firmicutes bacterium HGW-Firmicutes-1]|jgi:glycosyltransferase involved in cell wall biosynthesis|nr:MAG: transferase [Firmicutes bacterium HGW-Firmicutes-1]